MSGGSPRPERELLLGSLNAQRRHVLGILDGLSDDALATAALPSGWTCAGLVRHLALDVERFWFREVLAGDASSEVPTDDAWHPAPDDVPSAMVALYRREIERANEALERFALDDAPLAWPEEQFGSFRMNSLRELLVHVITETATHAGHLDATRELLDGRTWLVVD
jgi:uncharacterized damage-inducible protein DinB